MEMPTAPAIPTERDPGVIRVFLSSTFRDFVDERELIVSRVFPELRRRCRDRGIEIIGIDLRWGITEEESRDGRTLPICLNEIDRCRPWFVGLLGERYGWIPSADRYTPSLLEEYARLGVHAGASSVTELEFVYGALESSAPASRAAFFLRDPAWALARGAEFLCESDGDAARLSLLRDRVLASGCAVQAYANPEDLADLLTERLWAWIEADHPQSECGDPSARERRFHAAFAARAAAGCVCRGDLVDEIRTRSMDDHASGGRLVSVVGPEGSGKSTLVAAAVARCREAGPAVDCFEHHVGCSRESVEIDRVLRRLGEWCLGRTIEEQGYAELARSVPDWLAALSARLASDGRRGLIVFDGLECLHGPEHLPWLPAIIPAGITVLVSAAEGAVADVLSHRAEAVIRCGDLLEDERPAILAALLARQGKRLDAESSARIVAHPDAGRPAFLAAVVHDLTVSADHERLGERLDDVLGVSGLGGALERTLARAEEDIGRDRVVRAVTALATSRGGLTAPEVLERCRLAPMTWARIEAALGPMLASVADSVTIGSASARRAIEGRCLPDDDRRRSEHSASADWWLCRGPDERSSYELPYQLDRAGRHADLRRLLLDPIWIAALLQHRGEGEINSLWRAALQGESADLSAEYERACREWLGADHDPPDGHLLMRLGGFISHASGSTDFTVALLERAVEEGRRERVPEPELALRLNNLGHEQLQAGRIEPAVASFRECLEIRSRCLSQSHPHTLATLDNLGQAHGAAGRGEDAVRYLRTAYKLRLRHLGDHDADTATSRNNLAMTLLGTATGPANVEEAGQLLETAYAHSVHVLGPRHPDTGVSAANLGFYHALHGAESRARELMESALSIHREHFGEDHEYVAIGRARLRDFELQRGIRARDEGRLADARTILEAELERRRADHGDDSLPWASAARSLGELLAIEGDVEGAKELLVGARDIRARELGTDHALTQGMDRLLDSLG